jgi:hypothetical protein
VWYTAIPKPATGRVATVAVVLAVFPSTVAVIVAVPRATPVTTPAESTVAIDGFEVLQATARPVSTLPPVSRATAERCTVSPR